MPNYEARLKVSHDCPYCALTERYPGLRITSWDNASTHVAVVTSSVAGHLEGFQRELSRYMPVATVSRQGDRLEVVINNRDCDPRGVTALIAGCDCWSAQPSVAEEGWESYRVFSWDKANLYRLVREIEGAGGIVRLESVRPVGLPSFAQDMLTPAGNILHGLTPKQVEMLVSALERGYYDTPARISADDLATLMSISRSTLTEHLRKAEGRLMLNLLPILRMARDEA